MGVYKVGVVIRKTRESLGIARKELCDGICTIETLNRIENGQRTPNRATFQALMERMGKCGEKYFPYFNGPMDLLIMREDISRLVGNRRYEEAERKLIELKKRINGNDKVNQQFVLREEALIDYRMGRIDQKEKRKRLIEALKCTVPYYNDEVMSRDFFSRGEILLFCNIAVSYAEENDLEKAINMLYQMKAYFDRSSIDLEERSISESFVLSNLEQCLGRNGEPEEAIKIANKAIKLCLDYGKGISVPGLLFNVAYETRVLYGDTTLYRKRMAQAYYLAEINGNEYLMNHIKKDIQDNHGICSFNQLVSSPKSCRDIESIIGQGE